MNRNLPLFSIFALLGAHSAISGDFDPKSPVYSEKAPIEYDWGGPVLGTGFKTNDQFSEASFFAVVPWMNTIGEGGDMEGSVIFLEPYGTWAEEGEWGGSLGFGFRHLFSNQSVAEAAAGGGPAGFLTEGVFVGANVFADYAESPYGSEFWQTGAGVEVGTRYIEFRSNYYHPHGGNELVGSRTVTDVTSRTSSSSRSYTSPSANGTQTTTRVNTTTTRTTSRTTSLELFEEALEGWDAEVAVLVPGIDEIMDVTLIGGYYGYSGERLTSDIDGWRAGVEVRPVPAMVLHATWFEDEGLYQENWMAGVRFEIPLDRKAAREAFRPRRRHLVERLFEPVSRKNTAVTFGGEEQSTGTKTTTNTDVDVDRTQTTVPVKKEQGPPELNEDDMPG